MTLGKPSEFNMFYDLGDEFVKAVLASRKDFDEIDVMFDRYREISRRRKKRS